MDPSRGVQIGACGLFNAKIQSQSSFPKGVSGNGVGTLEYPYAVTPVKYFPSGSSSVGRSDWNGWRYGSGYIGPNEGKVYGEPDYKLYRQNYCGPCGCGPDGNRGDPNGKNPNIRYVQLDYKNLLGSGLAQQNVGQSATSQFTLNQGPPSTTHTSCGRDHCPQCSGVFKKTEQPVKFQVCIGDPDCPETMPPCPQQHLKVYVPKQMVPPKNGPSGDQAGQECEENLQEYEVHIPGKKDQYQTNPQNDCNSEGDAPKANSYFDPCGSCKACKGVQKRSECKPQAQANGQNKCSTGPILANVKKPSRRSYLRK